MLNIAQFPVPVKIKHKSPVPVPSPIPSPAFDPQIESAILESCPYKASTWRKDIFSLARRLAGIGNFANAFRKGDVALLQRIVGEWSDRYLSDYDPAIVWQYFQDVAFPGVRFPKRAEGAFWDAAWRKALDSVCGRRSDPVAGSIIAENNFKSPAVRLVVCLCLELQRQRSGHPFPLSSYRLADHLDRQLGNYSQFRSWRILKKLVNAGVLEIASRGSHGISSRKANLYRVRGLK